MINLLPEKNKKELLMEKNRKITSIVCSLWVSFIIILSLLFLVINIYLAQQVKASKNVLVRNEKELSLTEAHKIQDKIKLANTSFIELNSFYNRKVYFSGVLKKISNILPEGFYLTNLSIKLDVKENKIPQDNGRVDIEVERKVIGILSGFAPLREDLLFFKESLEKEESFEEIFFPSSNWVDKQDINFSLTFRISL